MEDREANPTPSILRQPFVHTANALAALYKQSLSAEREARDAGARSAYQTIMQWAARKSRSNENITPADIISLCAAELASLPAPMANSNTTGRPLTTTTTVHPPQQHQHQQRTSLESIATSPSFGVAVGTGNGNSGRDGGGSGCGPGGGGCGGGGAGVGVAYIARDESLLSDIRKLNVNPRKRQRVEISDTFVRACDGVDNAALIFSDDYGYAMQSAEHPSSPAMMQTDATSPHASRKDAVQHKEGVPIGTTTTTSSTSTPSSDSALIRKAKGGKGGYDKLRKK